MEKPLREVLEAKAKEINDSIFGRTRKKKVPVETALKKQVDASVKFALGHALKTEGLPNASKDAFVSLLKEQPDAINLLLVDESNEQKAVEMLSPLFSEKSKEFLESFQSAFNSLQLEIDSDKKGFNAG